MKTMPIKKIIIITCIAIFVVLLVAIYFVSYTIFFTQTRSAVNAQMIELTNQIVYNYENYIYGIVNTSDNLQIEANKYTFHSLSDSQQMSVYLDHAVSVKSDVKRIQLVDGLSGEILASNSIDETGQFYNLNNEKWYQQASSDASIYWFMLSEKSESGEYTMIASKMLNVNGRRMVLKVELSFENFITLAKKTDLGASGNITIVDKDYNVIYSSIGISDVAVQAPQIEQLILGSAQTEFDNHTMFLSVDTLSNTKWRICIFVNTDAIRQIESGFSISLIITLTIVLGFGTFALLLVVKRITDPLHALESAMSKVDRDNNLYYEVDLKGSREVVSLANSFNKMMKRIDELLRKVIEEQTEQRKSELKALQNQINPHFLYNTMDSIMWLIEQKKNDEAGQMLSALAKLFRISISRGKNVVSVNDELAHVENYLAIQSIRYSGAFKYSINATDEVRSMRTIKLILQPIVENCLYHGLRDRIEEGEITIDAFVEGDYLIFRVKDNGYGIKEEKIQQLYSQFENPNLNDGVGLKNIYQRLLLYYAKKAKLIIESRLDEGTTITIAQPLNQLKEES